MYERRKLEEELAEIAAGLRTHVSNHIASAVSSEEENAQTARARAEQDAIKVAKEGVRATEAGTRAMQAAAAAQERAADEARRAREEGAEHDARMEELEERRIEEAAEAHALLYEVAQEEARAAERHRGNLEEMETLRIEREAERFEAELLRTSACYAAATQLAWLKHLELPRIEQAEYRKLYRAFLPLSEELAAALASSDVAYTEEERLREASEAAAATAVNQSNHAAAAAVEREVRSLETALRLLEADVVQAKSTWSPSSWFGEKARTRGQAPAKRAKIEAELKQARDKLQASKAVPCAQGSKMEAFRRARVRQLAADLEIVERRDAIFDSIHTWAHAQRRCHAVALHYEGAHVAEPAVDAKLCALLDQAVAAGSETVEYPGLGTLPSGPELAALIGRVAALKAEEFRFFGPTPGANEAAWLCFASVVGVFAPGTDISEKLYDEFRRLAPASRVQAKYGVLGGKSTDKQVDFSFDTQTDDELYLQAVAACAGIRTISISGLQRKLKIGYNAATRLHDRLLAEGVVVLA